MNVPLFDMRAETAAVRTEIDAAIERVLDSGVFIQGPEVAGFETELAAAAGCAHAIGTSSGTDALLVLMMALGIGAGDEVVTTPLTFMATAGAAARVGARVVFADVDDTSLGLDPALALSACTDRTRAIITVHMHGHPATVPSAPCPVIEDAAHSLIALPLKGIASALSFFPTKNLGAVGDAGAVLTNDPALADTIALLRTQGGRPKYHNIALGGNFRLDAIQAAVLRVKLAHLDAWTASRRAHAARYRELLGSIVRVPADAPGHVYHQFCIRTPRRDELRTYLAERGIGTEIYYPEPLHLAPVFASLGYRAGSFPIAERACRELLALPIHPAMPVEAPAYVAENIAAFFRG